MWIYANLSFDSIQMVDIAAIATPCQLLYGVEILKATICVMLVDFILRWMGPIDLWLSQKTHVW